MNKVEFDLKPDTLGAVGDCLITNEAGSYVNSFVLFKDSIPNHQGFYYNYRKTNDRFVYFESLLAMQEDIEQTYLDQFELALKRVNENISRNVFKANTVLDLKLASFGGKLLFLQELLETSNVCEIHFIKKQYRPTYCAFTGTKIN